MNVSIVKKVKEIF